MKINLLYKHKKKCLLSLLFGMVTLFNGCSDLVLINSKGQVGLEERSLILTAFGLMLIIVIPVIVMTIIFSLKYNSKNINSSIRYDPNWINSKVIEIIIWIIPILIITILSIITWKSTHKLDPKKPISLNNETPIIIDVISLDKKWLFIYPKERIAVINELVFPVCVPIKFNVTSNSVMNSFFIPQLGGQIYAMAGMHTELYLVANTPGKYKGISSNFSGMYFSNMKFIVTATKNKTDFNDWVKKVQNSPVYIHDIQDYEKLNHSNKYNHITYFSDVEPNLFYDVINKFTYQKNKCF